MKQKQNNNSNLTGATTPTATTTLSISNDRLATFAVLLNSAERLLGPVSLKFPKPVKLQCLPAESAAELQSRKK